MTRARPPAPPLAQLLDRVWYGRAHPLSVALAPFGWVYCAIARWRAFSWRHRWRRRPDEARLNAPVVVVGNLTVGGTGKTPLVLWLADHLRQRGWTPGILTRGYLGGENRAPRRVPVDGDPRLFGDEAVLLAARSGCPVMICRDRYAAARQLLRTTNCDILIADDGLQHYRLRRDLEILLIDGRRGFGNGRCLPAGPLREPAARARLADIQLINATGQSAQPRMELRPTRARNLADPRQTRALAQFIGAPITAVAGIGHPEQFFALLERHGLRISRRPYPDHHDFGAADLQRFGSDQVLMTEKDAVKCRTWATKNLWYLPVTAHPNKPFTDALDSHLRVLERRRADHLTHFDTTGGAV